VICHDRLNGPSLHIGRQKFFVAKSFSAALSSISDYPIVESLD
jgi:hypothetical protein